MEIGACSDIGKVRDLNEDSFFIPDSDLKLFIIADGMGGHNAGEVASKIAIDSIKAFLTKNLGQSGNTSEDFIQSTLKEAIVHANRLIYLKSLEEEKYKGMGTTLTVMLVLSKIFIGHVGDSRAYLLKDNKAFQITQDHSLVAELVRNGSITESEAKIHPQRNIITRALGTEENIIVDLYTLDIEKNNIIILCTDGLSNLVNMDEVKEIVEGSKSVEDGCQNLISLANERGGYDNITVLIIKM